jgi:LuxR family maltose regulon positive regulatory protein
MEVPAAAAIDAGRWRICSRINFPRGRSQLEFAWIDAYDARQVGSPTVVHRIAADPEPLVSMRRSRRWGLVSTTILSTKLYVPRPRPSTIRRPHLIERLNEGTRRELTLIAAPAGFGKTTLVSEWAAVSERPVAWLSLDEGDGEPTRFLAYVVAALQTIDPSIGRRVLGLLNAPQPPPTESILTALLNEVTTTSDSVALVLDDYHVIDSRPIDAALGFLLNHLPSRIRLVVSTREDPRLPLARLRAQDKLTELRSGELRFSFTEAAEFLNQGMGLNLAAEEIAALENRTEGWIAGLQMVALSLEGRSDTDAFVHAFTGSHRFVMDYLVEEVLQRQPEDIHSFLLHTAILDRLSGSLCDAVAQRDDGRAILAALERNNLFVASLDDNRQWYRYHHLFAEALQARLMEAQPDQISGLHRRASAWYEQNGLPSGAISHALAGRDFERAASLIELAWPEAEEGSRPTTWLRWVQALPDDLVRARPVLSVWYAYALLENGRMELAEAKLRDAERWLEPVAHLREGFRTPSAEMVVADEEQFRLLPATIAIGRAYHAQALGDAPGTVKYAQRALELLSDGDPLRRGQGSALLGLASWASGDLETADRVFTDYTSQLQTASNLPDAISTTFVLSEVRMALGRLREAFSTLEQFIQFLTERAEPMPPEAADLYRGLAELNRERGDLEAAADHLQRATQLGEHTGLSDWHHRRCVTQARLQQTQGELEAALGLLDEAERLFVRSPLPDVRPIAALKARIWIAQGRLTETLQWARERGLSIADAPNYLREFEQLTLARALIAQHRSERRVGSISEAVGLLERLLPVAELGHRKGSVIEILMLQALAHQARGSMAPAQMALKRALRLAEPEGFVRLFVDEGPPMARLLDEAAARGTVPHYTQRLLTAFRLAAAAQTRRRDARSASAQLLSEREREVLRQIADGLTNREIADRLYLSVYTVKAHARSIYEKLEANNRTQAVAKARQLGVLPRV